MLTAGGKSAEKHGAVSEACANGRGQRAAMRGKSLLQTEPILDSDQPKHSVDISLEAKY